MGCESSCEESEGEGQGEGRERKREGAKEGEKAKRSSSECEGRYLHPSFLLACSEKRKSKRKTRKRCGETKVRKKKQKKFF